MKKENKVEIERNIEIKPKKKIEGKTLKKIVAGALAFVCACTAGIVGFSNNWFGTTSDKDDFNHNQQLLFSKFFGSGISLTSAAAEVTDATDSGSITMTATVTPVEVQPYTLFDWGVSWKNAGSEWATDKTVTDYVTITPTKDGASTADVQCLQAFGEQVLVTVSVRSDSSYSASCVCDYEIRPDDYSGTMMGREIFFKNGEKPGIAIKFFLQANDYNNSNQYMTIDAFSGIGTVNPRNKNYRVGASLNNAFRDVLISKGFNLSPPTITEFPTVYDLGDNINVYSAGFPLVAIPGIELMDQSTQSLLKRGLRFATGMQTSSDVLTQDVVDVYMSYRSALKSFGDLLMFLYYYEYDTVSGEKVSYQVGIYASNDYLPELVTSASVSYSSVLF